MTAKTATPMTDALKHTVRPDARLLIHARKLESDRARLIEALKLNLRLLESAGVVEGVSQQTARSLLRELEAK